MHPSSRSRSRSSILIWYSIRGRHDRDSFSQSFSLGVRFSGSDASAVRISSSDRPTCWATRMTNAAQRVAREPPLASGGSGGVDQAFGLVEAQG